MKYLILILALIASPVYAKSSNWSLEHFDSELDMVNYNVNAEAVHIPGNCLIVALEKKRRLLKHGIKSEVVAFMPWKAQRKYNERTGKYEKIGHAVLCVGNKCLDNGDISHDIFGRDEIPHYGKILDNYRGKRLASF